MMKRLFSLALALVLGVSAARCGDGPLDPEAALQASVVSGEALLLRNLSSLPVYYTAFDPDRLAMFSGPCNRPDQGCASVPAGGEVRVPFSQIGGYGPDTRQVKIYWRHIVMTDAGWKAGELRDVTLHLDR